LLSPFSHRPPPASSSTLGHALPPSPSFSLLLPATSFLLHSPSPLLLPISSPSLPRLI
jgi:hypothetical protein